MRRRQLASELEGLPLWYRPVVSSRHVADGAVRAARWLTRLCAVLAIAVVVGEFWASFDQGTRYHRMYVYFHFSFPLDRVADFAWGTSLRLAYVGIVLGLAWWMRALAAQLDVDIVRARDEAALDLDKA